MPGGAELRALLALAVALAVPAGADEEACALTIRAEPAELTLGTGSRATLHVGGAGDAAPRLQVSAGRIDELRPDGAGSFAAVYHPPAESHPQLAIVSAAGASGCGFAVLRLLGQGDAEVKARRRTSVSVRIGDRVFGPVDTDGKGRATVPVVVPPGVSHALHGRQVIPLRPPPLRQVALALDPAEAATDRMVESRVLAFAAAEEGAAWTGPPPRLEVSEGTLSGPTRLGPGAFLWRWRVPAGRPRTAAVSARLEASRSLAAESRIELGAGRAARLLVGSARKWAAAGDRVDFTVRAADAAGNPAEGAPRLELSAGSLESLERLEPGAWRARVAVPESLGGRQRLELLARVGEAHGRAAVVLAPGAPSRIAMELGAADVVADGDCEVPLALLVADRFGNPVPEPPAVGAGRGSIAGIAPRRAGGWQARYRGPRLEERSFDTVRAWLGPTETSGRLLLLPRVRALSLAARVGASLRPGGASGPSAAIEAAFWPHRLRGAGGVALEVGWSSFERSDPVAVGAGAARLEGRAQFASALASGLWRFRPGPKAAFWLAGGGGLVLVASRVGLSAAPPLAETAWIPEAHVAAGAGHRLGPGSPFLEARLGWQADPGLDALRGSLTSLTLSLGYRLDLL
ncbi:MAG TPA: hypothetical protein VH880_06865 [Anaeromyxobacteraceae bacterium]